MSSSNLLYFNKYLNLTKKVGITHRFHKWILKQNTNIHTIAYQLQVFLNLNQNTLILHNTYVGSNHFEFPFMNYQVFIMASLQDTPKNMWCLDKIIKISTNYIFIIIMKMFFNFFQNNNLIIRLSNMMHPFWVYCHVSVCSDASILSSSL